MIRAKNRTLLNISATQYLCAIGDIVVALLCIMIAIGALMYGHVAGPTARDAKLLR
jgi:hypothetical protein